MERKPNPVLVSVAALHHSNQTSSQHHGTPADEGQVQKHVHSTSAETGRAGPTRGPSTRPQQRARNTGGYRQRGAESFSTGPSRGHLPCHTLTVLPPLRANCPRHPAGRPQMAGALFTQTLAKHVPRGAVRTLKFESHGNLEASHGFICSQDPGPLQRSVLWG